MKKSKKAASATLTVFIALFNALGALLLPTAWLEENYYLGILLGSSVLFSVNALLSTIALSFTLAPVSYAIIISSWIFNWLAFLKFGYPVQNLICAATEQPRFLGFAAALIIALTLQAFILAPNVFCIKRSKGIAQKQGAERENALFKGLIAFSLIIIIIPFSISAPLCSLNKYAQERLAPVHDELDNFVHGVDEKFEYGDAEILAEYLKSSKYKFTHIEKDGEADGCGYLNEYTFEKGNRIVKISIFNDGGYCASINPISKNVSHTYLHEYAPKGQAEYVRAAEMFGDYYDINDDKPDKRNCIGMTQNEIEKIAQGLGYCGLTIDKSAAQRTICSYGYSYDMLGDCLTYLFTFEGGVCTDYDFKDTW